MAAKDPVTVIPDSDGDSKSNDSDDEPDPYCTTAVIKVRVERLMNILPRLFPANGLEVFVLHDHDVHQNNTFVGDDHELSGTIDWECLLIVPPWATCEIPKFLQTKLNRHLCPDAEGYMKKVLEGSTEKVNSLSYEHLEEYEKTQLRVFFLEQMQRVCPQWVEIYENSKLKGAFGEIVAVFDDKSKSNTIDEWLDIMQEYGSPPSLGDMLHAHNQELLDCHTALPKIRRNDNAEMTEE